MVITKEEILKSLENNKNVPDGTFCLYLTQLVIAKCGGKEKIEEILPQIFPHPVKVVEIPSYYDTGSTLPSSANKLHFTEDERMGLK